LTNQYPEDQQRINSFSKLNTRMRSIDEKLEELKVGFHTLFSPGFQ